MNKKETRKQKQATKLEKVMTGHTTTTEVHDETKKTAKAPKAPKEKKERKPAVFNERPKTQATDSESRLTYFAAQTDHMTEKDLMLLEPCMAKDDMTVGEIAEAVGLNNNQVSGALSVLVPKGLVETVKVRRDGEKGVVRVVRMTAHGKKVYRKCESERDSKDN